MDLTERPPTPFFSESDNAECREEVTEYFDYATKAYEYTMSEEAKLDKAYTQILTKQEAYGIELVGNKTFLEWTLSDWDEGRLGSKPDYSP